jgi:hypothetical protein
MGNMSYCRFENTGNDLADCVENWESDDEDFSDTEQQAKDKIIELAREIVSIEGN